MDIDLPILKRFQHQDVKEQHRSVFFDHVNLYMHRHTHASDTSDALHSFQWEGY